MALKQRRSHTKSITSFKKYRVRTGGGNYIFRFRDAVTGNLLASFTATGIDDAANRWVYRNFTLALIGKPGGSGAEAFTIMLIQHGN